MSERSDDDRITKLLDEIVQANTEEEKETLLKQLGFEKKALPRQPDFLTKLARLLVVVKRARKQGGQPVDSVVYRTLYGTQNAKEDEQSLIMILKGLGVQVTEPDYADYKEKVEAEEAAAEAFCDEASAKAAATVEEGVVEEIPGVGLVAAAGEASGPPAPRLGAPGPALKRRKRPREAKQAPERPRRRRRRRRTEEADRFTLEDFGEAFNRALLPEGTPGALTLGMLLTGRTRTGAPAALRAARSLEPEAAGAPGAAGVTGARRRHPTIPEGGARERLPTVGLKSPTSLSVFPDKSPQLQGNEPSAFNAFTTKNVNIADSKGRRYNTVLNGRLAYRRAARGANIAGFPTVLYGPKVERLTSKNYKKLKSGSSVYYDRGSVVFRGPFTFNRVLRGPVLELTAKDIAYDNVYKFILRVSDLPGEKLYYALANGKVRHKGTRSKARRTAGKGRATRKRSRRKSVKRKPAKKRGKSRKRRPHARK